MELESELQLQREKNHKMIDVLLKNQSFSIRKESNLGVEQEFLPNEQEFLNFLNFNNGGYFFGHSIHFFGLSNNADFHDLLKLNDLVKKKYGQLFKGLAFGEDVFGNLFTFENGNWFLFILESGEQEYIANSFVSLVSTILNDIEYYSGLEYLHSFNEEDIQKLSNGYRLAPKYPFVLGGDYLITNLVLKKYDENIGFSSSIANQIQGKADGDKFRLIIE